jgi:hypothetical protein
MVIHRVFLDRVFRLRHARELRPLIGILFRIAGGEDRLAVGPEHRIQFRDVVLLRRRDHGLGRRLRSIESLQLGRKRQNREKRNK